MAKDISDNLATKDTRTIIVWDNDDIVIELEAEDTTRTEPDGTIATARTDHQHVLPDGTLLKAEMLTANPGGDISMCRPCRTPLIPLFRRRGPTHGIFERKKLESCADCGRLCCRRHRASSPWDQQWRCFPCAIKHVVKQLMGYLVFTRD